MASGNPQFGPDADKLDIGQIGGVRQLAGQAFATIQVVNGPPQTRDVKNALPQQDIAFVDKLGESGRLYTWVCMLRTDTAARLFTIEQEIKERLTGVLYDNAGGRTRTPSKMNPAKLTDQDGNVLSTEANATARMVNAEFGPKFNNQRLGSGGRMMAATLVFEVLE